MDPNQFLQIQPLFKEATRWQNGVHIKDLSYLGRDLKQTVLIETNAEAAQAQPHNSIILRQWDGNKMDTALLEIVPFLEALSRENVPDVREVIKHLSHQSNLPRQFREMKRDHDRSTRAGGFFGSRGLPGATGMF